MARISPLVAFMVLSLVLAPASSAGLQAPSLSPQQLQQCSSLKGLQDLATGLPEAKTEAKGAPAADVAAAARFWIWGYPLLPMAKAAVSGGIQQNAINKYWKQSQLMTLQTEAAAGVVAANADTLYVTAWLDLTTGPAVLTAPDTKGRFYVLELVDMWTNVIGNPGSPSTGTAANQYVVLPPGFKGSLAQRAGKPTFQSNTTGVWVIGRIAVSGPQDLAAANAVLAGFDIERTVAAASASHLRSAAAAATNLMQAAGWALRSVNNATAAFAAIAGMAEAFPPTADTAAPGKGAAAFGFDLSKGFSQTLASAQQAATMRAGYVVGQACINAFAESGQLGISLPTGWSFPTKAGLYGSDYLLRAAVSMIGLGANTPQVSIYGANYVDEQKKQLNGSKGAVYSITFSPPPTAKWFTSLTAYDLAKGFLMSNKYSDRADINFQATPGLQRNKDGSLTVWVSAAPPGPKGSKELANWLPIAPEPFWVMLRFYGPSQDMIDGKVPLPAFKKIK